MTPEAFGKMLADAAQAMQRQVADAIKGVGPAVAAEVERMRGLVAELVAAEVEKALAARPSPVELADAVTDQDGNLVLVLSNGTTKTLGRVLAKDGKAGEPGKDGLAFDDFSIVTEGPRPVLRFAAKGRQADIPVPGFVYCGVWEAGGGTGEGGLFVAGDAVTLGGNLWTAKAETTDRPGQGDAWQLAVRAGRDAKRGAS